MALNALLFLAAVALREMAVCGDAGDKSTSQADQFIDCPLVFFPFTPLPNNSK